MPLMFIGARARREGLRIFAAAVVLAIGTASTVTAQSEEKVPPYLRDRGTGIPTSMFGTYVRPGELIVYPFYERYIDHNLEYRPEELGVPGALDFSGRYRANEGLLLVAYGFSPRLAVEFEMAGIRASLDKAAADNSALPSRIQDSGLGDVEGQVRWRWRPEDERRPEVFSYFEAVVPHHGDRPLIGTDGWELKFGTGFIRGHEWGTLTVRAALEYAQASTSPFDVGEYAVEYLRRVSPAFRVYLGVEGTQDEVGFIAEGQWHLSRYAFVKFNSGVGLTSKATDWAPEVGVVFALPVRR